MAGKKGKNSKGDKKPVVQYRHISIKTVDDRGIESLKIAEAKK